MSRKYWRTITLLRFPCFNILTRTRMQIFTHEHMHIQGALYDELILLSSYDGIVLTAVSTQTYIISSSGPLPTSYTDLSSWPSSELRYSHHLYAVPVRQALLLPPTLPSTLLPLKLLCPLMPNFRSTAHCWHQPTSETSASTLPSWSSAPMSALHSLATARCSLVPS